MTAAERMEQRGFEKGLAKGKAKLLERLLVKKFGSLSPRSAEQLRHATESDLERWTDRILSANTIDAVFADGDDD